MSQGIWKFLAQFVLGCLVLIAIACGGCGIMSMSCTKVLNDHAPTSEQIQEMQKREQENIKRAEMGLPPLDTRPQPQ